MVYSGDTRPCANVVEHTKRVNLLIYEAHGLKAPRRDLTFSAALLRPRRDRKPTTTKFTNLSDAYSSSSLRRSRGSFRRSRGCLR
jgi:hypothetical protein